MVRPILTYCITTAQSALVCIGCITSASRLYLWFNLFVLYLHFARKVRGKRSESIESSFRRFISCHPTIIKEDALRRLRDEALEKRMGKGGTEARRDVLG